ncbi:TPA: phytanoyl-CoA dioxygenase family protein [Salmonella enterica subsp. enterica serovar Newport]
MNIIEKMNTEGYCVIPRVLNNEEINLVRNFYSEISKQNNLTTLLPTDILKHSDVFNLVIKNKIIKSIKLLFGKDFSLFPNFTIRESVYIPWHNDAYFLPNEIFHPDTPLQFMQCAIYLQDNDMISGGGVTVIPFSHRLDKVTVLSMLETPHIYEEVITSKAGDLILWDNRITHRSTYPDETPNNKKIALQWTVTASEKYNDSFLKYLCARVKQNLHVSDFLNKSPKPYFADMSNVIYPDSFSKESLDIMKKYNVNFIGL